MEFFLHYVGIEGSARDFPKTVFTERPTSLILENVPDGHPFKGELLLRLGNEFPDGRWNCWGVPSGARSAISRLSEGDVVLLMETSSGYGPIPAFCRVKVYVPEQFPKLSRALWGDRGFPYIFFFDTIPLRLTWPDLRSCLGYADTYSGPYGQVQRIAEKHVLLAGGAEQLEMWLLSKAVSSTPVKYSLNLDVSKVQSPEIVYDVKQEHDKLLTTSIQSEPQLTDNIAPRSTTTFTYPRTEAFRLDIRHLYGERCAICGLGLVGPNGEPEVQSAHIYPRHLKGKDDLRNGICLCRMHHWALDIGWIAFSDVRKVITRSDLPKNLDYDFIRKYRDCSIQEPSAIHFAPHKLYLKAHRELYGFESGS